MGKPSLVKLCCNPPDSCIASNDPGSISYINSFFMSFLGTITKGGTINPAADIHITTATKESLSTDNTLWTFLFPFMGSIFCDLCWTIVKSVFSTLYTFVVSNFIFNYSAFSMQKNCRKLCSVNKWMQASDNDWGFWTDSSICRFKKQFIPAVFASDENGCGKLLREANWNANLL